MVFRVWFRSLLLLSGLGAFLPAPALRAEPIQVLFVDGQNNHNWFDMTPRMKATLEATGRFRCTVVTAPAADDKDKAAKWAAFRPDFSRYQGVVSNYGIGDPWPQPVREAFVQFVSQGGGFVAVHASTNPFPEWKEFNDLIGLGWRAKDFGQRLTIDDQTGKAVVWPRGQGQGAGHGGVYPYVVTVRKPDHPIVQDFPARWMHAQDEIYHGQRGPAEHLTVLDSAYSDPQEGGTGLHEPLSWVRTYGKGRVFVTMLGHVRAYGKYPLTFDAIECVGFQALFARGMEWAATGTVTLPVPRNFPGVDKPRIAKPAQVQWKRDPEASPP